MNPKGLSWWATLGLVALWFGWMVAPVEVCAQESEEGSSPAVSTEQEAPSEGVAGTATYYAKRFNGRRTTSGARYRPEKMTAAHPDLPLGTRVKVVHLDSGREVVVTVNDRCRRRRAPIIDLSRAAAKELGFLGRGRARVQIIPLMDEVARDSAPPPPPDAIPPEDPS